MSYLPEIVLPENPDDKYRVDLVHTSDDNREHRLELARYTSWGEAEEHHTTLISQMNNFGLEAIADDIERLQDQINNPLPYTFGDDQQPIKGDGEAIPHHIDGGGTVHWFDRVESRTPEQSPYELRYFRAYEVESGNIRHDSYPVMPLAEDDPNLAWPLHGLDMYLEQGDVLMAQQFAKDVSDAYEQPFPDPMDLPSLNPDPEYYFGYGVGPNSMPSLEAVKTWVDGTNRQFDTLTVGEYGSFDEVAIHERELEQILDSDGLERAINLAEEMAVAGGYLDPERDDSRIFLEEDAPPDPFTTIRQTQLLSPELETQELPAIQVENNVDELEPALSSEAWMDAIDRKREENAQLEGADWFEATFDEEWQLLEPLDDTVNYGVSVEQFDPWTVELSVDKVWRRDDNFIGTDTQIIQSYDLDAREQAETDKEALLDIYEQRGLQGMMRQAELQAMKNGELSADRPNGELFRNGPPDRFETLAQRLEGEINPYWNTDGESFDDPEPEPTENPYWRMETVRANNPDGEQIGHTLQMVVYSNMEQPSDEVGAPDIPDDEPFKILEMAHFESPEDADKFSKEFRSYIVPGLLDGPELAVEVARLEEHPIEWKSLDGQDLNNYRNMNYVVTHDVDSWKLYNPNAERDARIAVEGISDDILVSKPENELHSGNDNIDWDL